MPDEIELPTFAEMRGGHRRRSRGPGPRRPRPWLYVFYVGAFGGLVLGVDRRCAMAPRARALPRWSRPIDSTPAAPLRLPPGGSPRRLDGRLRSVSPAAAPGAPSCRRTRSCSDQAPSPPSPSQAPRRRANWTTWATLSRQSTDATRPARRKGGGSRRESEAKARLRVRSLDTSRAGLPCSLT